jgi:hypothetical protein
MTCLIDEIPAVTDRDTPANETWNALSDLWVEIQTGGVRLTPRTRALLLRAAAHACESANREGRAIAFGSAR